MPRVLGIDCGGSSTRAVVVDGGETVWSGRAGPANLSSCTDERIRQSLEEALAGCPDVDAGCGAFAGLVDQAQKEAILRLITEIIPRARIEAVPDFEAALAACPSADVCIIGGTGSLVCSHDPKGGIFRSGGGGYILGDEGSAFQYGRDALLHFLDDPPDDISNELRLAVSETFGATRRYDVISAVYRSAEIPKQIAALAAAFSLDAAGGAIYALKSLRIHSSKLAHVVAKHLRQYHPDMLKPSVCCQGGLWSAQVFRAELVERLSFWCKVEEMTVDFDPPAPVYGAVELAKKLL
jgi:N-acetylglucosamine kinase-like BadF-type ATPase